MADQADTESDEDDIAELSLDDLGAAYARAAAQHDPEAFAPAEVGDGEEFDSDPTDDVRASEVDEEQLVSPEMIIEGALFVGHPDGKPITEHHLASLMRDVTPEEVVAIIEQLNQAYRREDQALRIVGDDNGYRITIAPEVENVRRSFLGKVREAKLSQAAVEVLALVAYQPGVTLQKVQDQRGRESASLLNQLVRRQLLRIERIKPAEVSGRPGSSGPDSKRPVPQYYTTERFLYLFGLESIDDLPQVEEGLREG